MLRLNFCVRYGNRWIPQAIVTGNSIRFGSAFTRFLLTRFLSGSPPSIPLMSSRLRFRTSFPEASVLRSLCLFIPFGALRFQAFPHLQNRTGLTLSQSAFRFRFPASLLSLRSSLPLLQWLASSDQALDLLVSASCICYHTSTADLSTSSSLRGLTYLCSGSLLLQGGFTLRCLQRLSRPHFASQLCLWQDNCCTRGASIPVLSY